MLCGVIAVTGAVGAFVDVDYDADDAVVAVDVVDARTEFNS